MSASLDVKTPTSKEHPGEAKSPGKETGVRMATIEDDDERLLAEIGYEQVRIFSETALDLKP